ncbi:hypothetical protein Vretifemale_15903, partial [Volvox reticuliferus]
SVQAVPKVTMLAPPELRKALFEMSCKAAAIPRPPWLCGFDCVGCVDMIGGGMEASPWAPTNWTTAPCPSMTGAAAAMGVALLPSCLNPTATAAETAGLCRFGSSADGVAKGAVVKLSMAAAAVSWFGRDLATSGASVRFDELLAM